MTDRCLFARPPFRALGFAIMVAAATVLTSCDTPVGTPTASRAMSGNSTSAAHQSKRRRCAGGSSGDRPDTDVLRSRPLAGQSADRCPWATSATASGARGDVVMYCRCMVILPPAALCWPDRRVAMGERMRLLLATLSHETNTFSPVPTKLERFCRDGTTLLSGQTAIDFYRGTGTCMGGYLAVADELGAEVVVPVCASAPPSGPVDSDAYETFCRMITDAVAKGGFDALWLDLHGAMVTDRFDDGEGELLRRIRAIDPKTPICVAYDMHANVFDAMVSNAQIVTGYQTYPHIDQRQTAERPRGPCCA